MYRVCIHVLYKYGGNIWEDPMFTEYANYSLGNIQWLQSDVSKKEINSLVRISNRSYTRQSLLPSLWN